MLPFLAMLVCCLVGGIINDRLTKWRDRVWVAVSWQHLRWQWQGIFIAFGSQVQGARVASIVLGRWRWKFVSRAKFLLVGDCRYCGGVGRFGVGIYEHGRSNRRRCYRFADPMDCRTLRLDSFFSGGIGLVSGWCSELDCGEPAQSSHGGS